MTMTQDTEIEWERGLCYAYEVIDEFERKQIPIEKQLAIAFETGREIGRCELKVKVANIFKPDKEWA